MCHGGLHSFRTADLICMATKQSMPLHAIELCGTQNRSDHTNPAKPQQEGAAAGRCATNCAPLDGTQMGLHGGAQVLKDATGEWNTLLVSVYSPELAASTWPSQSTGGVRCDRVQLGCSCIKQISSA